MNCSLSAGAARSRTWSGPRSRRSSRWGTALVRDPGRHRTPRPVGRRGGRNRRKVVDEFHRKPFGPVVFRDRLCNPLGNELHGPARPSRTAAGTPMDYNRQPSLVAQKDHIAGKGATSRSTSPMAICRILGPSVRLLPPVPTWIGTMPIQQHSHVFGIIPRLGVWSIESPRLRSRCDPADRETFGQGRGVGSLDEAASVSP